MFFLMAAAGWLAFALVAGLVCAAMVRRAEVRRGEENRRTGTAFPPVQVGEPSLR